MEPFEIRSTPAKLGLGYLAILGFALAVVFYVVWILLQVIIGVIADRDDSRSPGGLLVVAGGLLLIGVFVRLLLPQLTLVRRYFTEDRGQRVLTFRFDDQGWHWLQAGTNVLLPWDGMKVRVAGRNPEKFFVVVEQPNPVLSSDDVLSRQLHRNLRRRPANEIPFTRSNPSEDELVAAIERLSGGRVIVDRETEESP